MAKEVPNHGLINHYVHVVCALNETRKGTEMKSTQGEKASNALDNTIVGLCQLIDNLVAQEQRDMVRTGVNA